MLNSFGSPSRLLVTTLAALALVTGCDKGDSAATDTSRQAARENVEAMAREHADDTTAPSEAAQIEPQHAVISERLPCCCTRTAVVSLGRRDDICCCHPNLSVYISHARGEANMKPHPLAHA